MGQLGDTLRERRLALGIGLDQAEADTKIRSRLLQALEEGEYSRLPNPGYVRGYVSSYARYLELDPIPLLAMYRAETGVGRFHEINLPDETAVEPRHAQHELPWRVAIIVLLVVGVLSLGVWVALRVARGPQKPVPVPTTPSQASSGTAAPGGPGVPQTAVNTQPFTVKVTVSTNGASSLKVTVDGATAYNGTLTAGQSEEFQVTGSAVLVIGKPSAVTVTRDGKKVTLPKKTPATLTLQAAQAK